MPSFVVGGSDAAAAGAAGEVAAVAGRAFPAAGVGEAPRLVGAVALIERGDLARGLRDAHERGPQLGGRAPGDDEARAHRLALLARLADLHEAELLGGLAGQPASCEVEAGLRILVG